MKDESTTPTKTAFEGIFGRIRKSIMTDEYIQAHEDIVQNEEPVAAPAPKQVVSAASAVATPPVSIAPQQPSLDVEAMVKKIYATLEEMNRPGIDFLEFLNAAQAMGGPTDLNFKSAFKVLNIAGAQLTIESLVSSAQYYITELEHQIGDGIKKKQSERDQLVEQQKTDRKSLTDEVSDLKQKILELQTQQQQKEQSLAQLDSTYAPKVALADQKITIGSMALQQVLKSLKDDVELVRALTTS